MQQLAGARDGFARQFCRKLLRQSRGDAGTRQLFGEQENIGGAGAGDRGHRVHQ